MMTKEERFYLGMIIGADRYIEDMFDRSGHRADWQNRIYEKIIQVGKICFRQGYERGKRETQGSSLNFDEKQALREYLQTEKVNRNHMKYFQAALRKLEE